MRWIQLLTQNANAVVAAIALASGAWAAEPARAAARPTEPFRKEHAELKEHLAHADAWVVSLNAGTAAKPAQTMADVIGFFKSHIIPHAKWEEQVLYPAVDKRAGAGSSPFTASMRYEHGIVARWTEELAAEAAKPKPDAKAFARTAQRLLGLVVAHFEEEEEVLLPILDRTMTPEQFEKEIGHHSS